MTSTVRFAVHGILAGGAQIMVGRTGDAPVAIPFECVDWYVVAPLETDDESLGTVVAEVRRLRIHGLHLTTTRVTDRGLVRLAGAPWLRALGLEATATTDAGLAHLAPLARLRELRLGGCPITDRGAEILGRMATLRALDVSGTEIGDPGLAAIARNRKLEALDLDGSRVTDMGLLQTLTGLRGLRRLDVSDLPGITDDLIDALAGPAPRAWKPPDARGAPEERATAGSPRLRLEALRELKVRHTEVTEAGVARLRAERPGLRIVE